ncbi:hypothetical protein EON65_21540 [archaeon]|nr:MAG: hypothetical protein EON65_21540 [archaeon]
MGRFFSFLVVVVFVSSIAHLCYSLAADSSAPFISNIERLRAADVIIHIGPPKTATSHIQHNLLRLSSDIDKAGWCYPAETQKELHAIGEKLRLGESIKPAQWKKVHACLESGKKLIFSTERLGQSMSNRGFKVIKDFFKGYKVHIVVAFRDSLTMAYSWYNQATRNAKASMVLTFGDHVAREFSQYDRRVLSNAIFEYADAFGIQNMTVIDFYGMIAAKKDPAYVFLCEIVGILCEAFIKPTEDNVSTDLKPYYLFNFVKNFAFSLGCKFMADDAYETILERYREDTNITSVTSINSSLPILTSQTLYIANIARHIEQEVRRAFGSVMIYQNATANEIARRKLRVEEVDDVQFFRSEHWTQWLWREIKLLRDQGAIGKCRVNVDFHTLSAS